MRHHGYPHVGFTVLKCTTISKFKWLSKYRYLYLKFSGIIIIIIIIIMISKLFRKYVSDIPGYHDVKELQKTAILGTAHILRKVLT